MPGMGGFNPSPLQHALLHFRQKRKRRKQNGRERSRNCRVAVLRTEDSHLSHLSSRTRKTRAPTDEPFAPFLRTTTGARENCSARYSNSGCCRRPLERLSRRDKTMRPVLPNGVKRAVFFCCLFAPSSLVPLFPPFLSTLSTLSIPFALSLWFSLQL